MTDNHAGNEIVADRMEIECPLCHEPVDRSLEDHLLEAHSRHELATLIESIVFERLESV